MNGCYRLKLEYVGTAEKKQVPVPVHFLMDIKWWSKGGRGFAHECNDMHPDF
jgi:hypothetical protein